MKAGPFRMKAAAFRMKAVAFRGLSQKKAVSFRIKKIRNRNAILGKFFFKLNSVDHSTRRNKHFHAERAVGVP